MGKARRARSSKRRCAFFASASAYFGRDHVPGHSFDGRVDELSIYDRALTEAEAQAIYAAGSSGRCRARIPAVGPLRVTHLGVLLLSVGIVRLRRFSAGSEHGEA